MLLAQMSFSDVSTSHGDSRGDTGLQDSGGGKICGSISAGFGPFRRLSPDASSSPRGSHGAQFSESTPVHSAAAEGHFECLDNITSMQTVQHSPIDLV